MRMCLAVVTAASAVACSSSPTVLDAAGGGKGVATAAGSFNGQSIAGLTYALSELTTSSNGTALQVVLTQTATCGDVSAGPSANAVFLDLTLYSTTAGSAATTAPKGGGEFELDLTGGGPFATASVVTFDATCTPTEATTGKITGGRVALKTVVDDTAVGSFDLTNGTDTLQGTFITALCVGAGELPFPASTSTCH